MPTQHVFKAIKVIVVFIGAAPTSEAEHVQRTVRVRGAVYTHDKSLLLGHGRA